MRTDGSQMKLGGALWMCFVEKTATLQIDSDGVVCWKVSVQ